MLAVVFACWVAGDRRPPVLPAGDQPRRAGRARRAPADRTIEVAGQARRDLRSQRPPAGLQRGCRHHLRRPDRADRSRRPSPRRCAAPSTTAIARSRPRWSSGSPHGPRAFVYVKRRVTPAEAQARGHARARRASASSKESKRFYPNRELAVARARLRRHRQRRPGRPRSDLRQGGPRARGQDAGADRRARQGVQPPRAPAHRRRLARAHHRRSSCSSSSSASCGPACSSTAPTRGTAVVMDPNTGEILAMANYPTFNPNVYAEAPENARRNRAIQDLYEPGSTFKLVTASAALEAVPVQAERDHRRQRRPDPLQGPRHQRHAPLRPAVVHRRAREVEQRRRHQDRLARRRRADGAVRPALRLRPPDLARTSPARARASCGRSSTTARWRRCRWATRSASRRSRW